ncbi:MAG TPA: nucleoside phosphorylase [Saprospiraceae bacterium]|nr:nucleoside phosphorylase [Saprospiraceae bacterium]
MTQIKDSELIINPDGSIYHLALRPEEVAPIIITVGDQNRVEKISRRFDAIEHRAAHREFVTHTGRLGRQRISVLSTGIGPDNIDIVLNELDALVNIDFATRAPLDRHTGLTLIRVGTTGGLQADIPVDSLVASHGAVGFDGLLHFYDAPQQHDHPLLTALRAHGEKRFDWQFPIAPYFVESDPALLNHFAGGFAFGLTATNPGFYGPQGRWLRAPLRIPDYIDLLQSFDYEGRRFVNLEMETSALLGLSALLGHRAASLSVVLANRADGSFSTDPDRAVERLIDRVLEKISDGLPVSA